MKRNGEVCCRCDADVSKATTDVFGTAQKVKKQNKKKTLFCNKKKT